MRSSVRNSIAIAVAVGLLCVPFVIIRVGYEIALIGARPEIEQLRSDLAGVAGNASEDMLGQATQWNQTIRRMQTYNSMWWGDPFIPDQWDRIAPITIPRGR